MGCEDSSHYYIRHLQTLTEQELIQDSWRCQLAWRFLRELKAITIVLSREWHKVRFALYPIMPHLRVNSAEPWFIRRQNKHFK